MDCIIPDTSRYRAGRKNEELVLGYLKQNFGHTGTLSSGSKGPADITTFNSKNTKFSIQAKLRTNKGAVTVSASEISALVDYADKVGSIPVVAVTTDDVESLLLTSIYSRNKIRKSEIIDVCGNLVAIELEDGFACTLFNLRTGMHIGYNDLVGVN